MGMDGEPLYGGLEEMRRDIGAALAIVPNRCCHEEDGVCRPHIGPMVSGDEMECMWCRNRFRMNDG